MTAAVMPPPVLGDSERARHPQSLAIQAYFDGWSQASRGPARDFPRLLTPDELESWRDGWLEAQAEGARWSPDDPPALVVLGRCMPCPILREVAP